MFSASAVFWRNSRARSIWCGLRAKDRSARLGLFQTARLSGRQRVAHGQCRASGNHARMSQALEGRQIMSHTFSNLLTRVIFST